MHRHRRSPLAIVLTFAAVGMVGAVVGCVPVGTNCTLEARSSVTVTVVDTEGTPLADATVSARVDGGDDDVESFDCELTNPVGTWVCGYEVEGDFVITASKTGYADASGAVTVGKTDDGCHVEGETLTLTLLADGPAFPE